MESVYLDHCATTPLDPQVMAAMMKYFGNFFGNPGSIHAFGREARRAVDRARLQVAALLGADPEEIVFTGGGTEADNLAILGLVGASPPGKRHLVTSAVEHPAVLNACRFLETKGYAVTYVPVDDMGRVDPVAVEDAINEETILISIMHGNNEIGVIEPLPAICAIGRKHGIAVHTDAVQTAGKIPFDVQDVAVDCLSVAGHKLYGPKGTGALYIRRGTVLKGQTYGGSQEHGCRAGTENVPGIVGLGMACEIALRDMAVHMDHTQALRDRLEEKLQETIPGIRINAHCATRLPHVLSVSVQSLSGDALVRELDKAGIAASAGATCHAGDIRISHVLAAMDLPQEIALGTVRFSIGKGNTCEEIDRTVSVFAGIVAALRNGSMK